MSTDAYELSPLQQGMLFHWLLDRHAGTDVEQIVADLREHIDPPRLERAWQHALATFSTLRTVFTWEGLSTPLQRIEPRASLRLHFEDFRYLELAERRERLNAYLNADRRDGFDLAQAPLMRVALFQMGDADFRMVWTFHHILIDGRALEIILNHLFAAYENDHQSQIVDRPYREYIEWVVRQSPEAARGFWRDELRGFSATTPLPTDRISREPPRPYDVIETQLPVDVTRRLRELAAREQLSLNTLIMAAWALVLSRHSGESDVIFGATKTTRRGTIADADSLIGLFLATVPVRLAVDADMRVLDWLKQVRDKWVSLRGYEHLPLVEIKQVSPLPPTVPLFESLVVFDRYHFGTGLNAQGGKWANRHFTHLEQTGYALTLTAFGDEPLWWKLEFDARRFKTTTVRRLSGHLLTILSAWSEEASAELWRTPMLPPAERQAIVDDWNATAADYPRSVPLAELLEAGAGRTPYAPAVTYGQETLSYRELNLRANRLARELQKHGIGPGRLVGISVERSLAMLVALLAVTKTGGAYVPLDPAFPTDRIAYMMADSGIQVLMTERRLRSTRPPFSGPVVEVDDETWQSNDDHDLGVQVDSSDPAYVIYTSGSTGKPKGVSVPRVALNNFLWAMRGLLGLDASDRVLAVTTISFDIAGMELWLPLMVGAHIVVASREAAADGRQLTDLLRHHDITFMQCTPVTGRLLLQAGWRGKEDLCLAMGGEALPTDLALALVPRVRRLWNLYGPTETTIWSTADLVGDPNAPISIGRPIANTRCYILDDRRQPVPIGAVGELYIGGDGVAKGYLNRPDLTDERFVLDPFVRGTGARMYRTGDRARFCEDGRIEFLGRNDDQVKIRGFRIELGEIEAVLGQCEGVAAAAVMVQSVPNGDERLVGYVVPKAGAALSFDALRRTLRVSLPEYMIPARFVMLETLPLTPNGKVDRKALPAPEADRQVERQLVEPRNDTERRLAAIWEEVLHIDRIGVHDSFFELGGNSLRAMEVIFRIQASFGAKLPLLRVLQDPTVAAVAAMLEESAAIHAGETAPKARLETGGEIQNLLEPHPAERHAPFPLTDVQEAYWIGRNSAFGIGNVACHVYLEEEIDDLDLDQYERAWQRLIERHDMLRAVVRPDGQQQVLAHTPAFKIPTQDLSDLPAGAAAAAIAATREDLSHQVRPSDRWPLFELRASRLGGNRYRIHLSYDLLIGDAWSFSILRRELDLLYAHPDITLEPLAITFRDYVLATARLRESPDYRRSLAYWDARSATLPARPELPLAKDPGSIEHPRFVRRHDSLDPESTGALRRRAEAFGLTLNGVLLAAYADVLATWSRRPRFLLNLTLFNRLPVHPQVNDLVGDFTSITLLDVELLPAETFLDLARKLLARLWEDLDHRFVSGVQVLRRLAREQPDRLNGAAPVVLTSTLGFGTAPAALTDLAHRARGTFAITQTPQVWIDHMVHLDDGRLAFDWDVVEDLFPPGMLDDMFQAYVTLVRRLAREDGAWLQPRVERVGTLVPERQIRQRQSVNATAQPVPDGLLHVLFERRAATSPERAAIVSGGVRLTYSDVSQLSRRLGRKLREMGALPNTLVAIVMEKGWEQVVAALGILQSGAAYVPIDANLPQERLHQLLENSGAAFALTQPGLDRSLAWPAGVRTLRVERGEPDQPTVAPLEPVQRPEDLAYVIYTSGSTGMPKGVMIDHRGAVNTIVDMNRRFGVGPDDRVLALSSLSFDLSVYDIFGLLAAGGTIVIPEPGATRDPERWADLVRGEGVTIWNSVPALVEMFVEFVSGRSERLPASLRLVLMSGDWIPVTLPDQIRAMSANVVLMSLGGATEASIWSILYPIERVDHDWKSIPYGRPMVNQTFHVLDDSLEPCPVWVPGQLHIGGIGLAKGYWRDAEKSAAKFIRHPRTGDRLYATGDLGRYLPSGDIEFLGREDFQVKIRGFRIELGEIEAAFRQHPAVRSAVVTAVGKTTAERRLVAYVVPQAEERAGGSDGGETPAEAAARLGLDKTLLDFLATKLPEHMCPSRIMLLDQLPLTPNGKVDLRSLPAPEAEPAATGIARAAPRSDTEALLVEVWRDVLKVRDVGVNDSFFDLGGDSVSAIQVVSRVHQRGYQLSPVLIFRHPTIAELASRLAPEPQPQSLIEEITL